MRGLEEVQLDDGKVAAVLQEWLVSASEPSIRQREEAKMLNLLRCDQMQGYLIGKPVPFEDMTALIRKTAKGSTVWADL